MQLLEGDCLEILKTLESESCDSLVTDPPAGISFMGKDWDHHKGGRNDWIGWMTGVMQECHRVMKPGAHGLVWALPRTSHWTATALEDAGFEVRDVVMHVFGTGFPKSLNVSKAIDKAAGAERTKQIGVSNRHGGGKQTKVPDSAPDAHNLCRLGTASKIPILEPATLEAKQWDGWGTALKPAAEHWILVRKPLGEKTVAKNVVKYGTGALNIDASRVDAEKSDDSSRLRRGGFSKSDVFGSGRDDLTKTGSGSQGRFPSHLIVSGEARDLMDEQSGVLKSGARAGQLRKNKLWIGEKTIKGGFCESSQGGASRFFYCAKASKAERNAGCEGMDAKPSTKHDGGDFHGASTNSKARKSENNHPTVKSQKLMRYLITMITPPGGTVLDPFMGSGSTGVAAKCLGFDFIGIERENEYLEIAQARISEWQVDLQNTLKMS